MEFTVPLSDCFVLIGTWATIPLLFGFSFGFCFTLQLDCVTQLMTLLPIFTNYNFFRNILDPLALNKLIKHGYSIGCVCSQVKSVRLPKKQDEYDPLTGTKKPTRGFAFVEFFPKGLSAFSSWG